MPTIRPSADIRNGYNEISDFCHQHSEPVFITKNGRGDLAVMSIESYEEIIAKLELYALIEQGLNDEQNGNVVTFSEGISSIKKGLS